MKPKLHIKRFYYRNGQTHTESREVAGNFHGAYRVWHRNGQLAEELRYRHGLMHGVSREWDETGRLLGSFTMGNGSGLQRYWHDNGQIKMEISSLNGKFHGPLPRLASGWHLDSRRLFNQQPGCHPHRLPESRPEKSQLAAI